MVITKRAVGITLALAGIAIMGGTFAIDLVGAGKWGGLGPAQRAALMSGGVILLIGLSLIPLGDKPA